MSQEASQHEVRSSESTRRQPILIARAAGPHEYVAGSQEAPVVLTTLGDLLQWAHNWPRSHSVWPFMYALASCGIELIS